MKNSTVDEKLHCTVGNYDYNLVPELLYSSRGHPFYVWTPEMPRIEDLLLQTVVYLYPSMEEADKGVSYGGAGFLMLVQTELPNQMVAGVPEGPVFHYAVTNKHVVDSGATVLRVNTRDGKTEAIPLARNQWIDHPNGDDLSIAQIQGLDHFNSHQVRYVPDSSLLTEDAAKALNIGPGDDVHMVGRFITHDGKQRNQPFVQSGIISLMPTDVETEWDDAGKPTKTEELFLIEMRSLSGCSGSPVFFEFPLMTMGSRIKHEHRELARRRWLLGIDCGHFKTHEKVFEVRNARGQKEYNPTKYEAISNAGQMMVIPAWKLRELIDHPRLAMVREDEKKKAIQKRAASPFDRDSRTKEKADITQESFQDILKRASRKIPPDEEKNEPSE